jgi:hypothetical protein
MSKFAILIFAALASQAQILVTISPQQSPYPLPAGLVLYSAVGCAASTETRNRTISAAQIRQLAEEAGLSFQDVSLNPSTTASAVAKSKSSRWLAGVQYFAAGLAVGAAEVTIFKTEQPNVGNAKTWGIITAAGSSLAAGIPITEALLQSKVSAVAAITNGVAAALITDMTALYSVPVGGCMKSVMFFGSGPAGVKSGILP